MNKPYKHGFPISYGANSELTDKEAKENLAELGRFVLPIIIMWCVKTSISMAIETPKKVTNDLPNDACPAPEPINTNNVPETKPMLDRPAPAKKPMFHNIMNRPTTVTNPLMQVLGAATVISTCLFAFILNDPRVITACASWLAYTFGINIKRD